MRSSLTDLEHDLAQHDDQDWHRTAGLLGAETHEVDRAAVPGWVCWAACQARATGALSIVIPPWTGVFGAAIASDASREFETAGAR